MWRDFSKVLRELLQVSTPGGAYRPDLHYMRGPGPKWRAKYGNIATKTTPPAASPAARPVLTDVAQHRA